MTDDSNSWPQAGWITALLISAIIGTICLTGGYAVNVSYNAKYWETTCTYTAYNFQPFTWNNWNCKSCTAYYASIVTTTSDGRTWYTHSATVYPPGNSVERQTRWYKSHWPIGWSVKCYQTGCCSNPPIFELADVVGTLWTGVAFLVIAGLIFVGLLISYIIKRRCCCRKGYTEVKDIDIAV
jgi:hypothetical protein